MKRAAFIAKLAVRLAAVEIERWKNQRVVRCMDCDPAGAPMYGRMRAPLAHQLASAHHATTGHLVTVRLG